MQELSTSDTINAHASALKALAGAHPIRVLVVDDEPGILTYITRILAKAGYETAVADNARDGLHKASTEGVFDLLVTDLRMPKMEGDELAFYVRRVQPGIKVLYVTGFSIQLFEEHDALREDEAFLDKPFNVKGLLEAISQLLWDHTHPPAASAASH